MVIPYGNLIYYFTVYCNVNAKLTLSRFKCMQAL